MICKDCRAEMKKSDLEGVLIDRCATCDGIWLDGDELRQLVKGEGEKDVTRLLTRAKQERATERIAVSSKGMCPRCNAGPLKRHVLHGVALDRCGECKGLWFDHGELERVRVKEEADTGILGMLKKLLTRE